MPSGLTFTPLTNAAPDGVGTIMLLTDGTVMAQGGGTTNTWYKLTPDASGSYVNGSWSPRASMSTERLYFGSNVLPDGRVFVLGGEYSGASGAENDANTGEIYDPLADSWSPTATFPQANFGDDPTQLLADGKILCGYLSGPQTYLYDPTSNTFTATGTKLRGDQSDEECWVKLPDGSILSYEIFSTASTGVFHAQRYLPATGTWVDASKTDTSIGSGFNLGDSKVGYELGPALLLSDGRVFQIGANGNTAFYNITTNTWSAGPQIIGNNGKLYGADDAPGAVLPDGQVLFLADEGPTLGTFSAPTGLFDFDPTTNKIKEVTPASLSGYESGNSAYYQRLLVLPSGQVLFADGTTQLYAITPAGAPQAAAVPTLSAIVANGASKFTLTGTGLNGLNEGAAYGDDVEMATNFPIVRLQDKNGNVSFARTTNWVSQVATGPAVVSTDFDAAASAGPYLLSVSANGVSSSNVLFVQLGAGANNVTLKLDSTKTYVQVTQGASTSLGQFALANFTAIDVAGTGALTLDYSNGAFGVPVTFHGTGASSLTIGGTSPLTTLAFDATGPKAGDFVVNGDAANPVTFTGVAAPVVSATAGTLTLNVDPSGSVGGVVTTTFTASGARTTAAPDNNLPSLTFASPSAALVVNGNAADGDHLVVKGVGTSFRAALTVPSNGGTDTVDVNANLHLGSATSSGNVAVTATTIDLAGTVDTTAGTTPGTITLTGNVNVTAAAGLTYGGGPGLTLGGGTLALGANTLTVTDTASTDAGTINDAITGTGGLTKAGPGLLDLMGKGTGFTGTATAAAGTLQVDDTIDAQVNVTGGTLTGTGTTGVVNATAGAVQPGDATPMQLNVVGGLNVGVGAGLNIGLAGAGANQSGIVSVAGGSITLGGTLNFTAVGGFQPAFGQVFDFVRNGTGSAASGLLTAGAGVDAVAPGTALAEGTVLSSNFLGSGVAAILTYNYNGTHDIAVLLTVQITSAPPTSPTTVGANYAFTCTALGSPMPTFSYSGTLPPGLTLDTTGYLHGSPTTPGTFTGSIIASNGQGTATQPFSITVNPAITLSPTSPTSPTSLPDDTINIGYNQTITASGGTGSVTLTVSNVKNAIAGINLPTGGTGSLNITGTPTASGTETFDVIATDQAGATTVGHYSITVNPAVALTPPPLPADTAGVAYSQTIAATGGTGVTNLVVTVQNAVPGLVVPASGAGSIAISGTPTQAGTETFTVTATDAVGATAGPVVYSILVNPAVTLSPATLPPDDAGNAYSATIDALGGTGSKALTVTNVVNPIPGLSLPLSGTDVLAISGSPTIPGTETFTLTATDTLGGTVSVPYTITVNPKLAFNPANLPADTVNIAYDQTLAVTGGTGNKTLTVTNISGTIPGLNVPLTGTNSIDITGTPTATGTESFTVTARDTLGVAISSVFSVSVSTGITLSPPPLPADTVGVAYNQLIFASGGTGNKALTVNVQSAVPGLVVPATATNGLAITGTPTQAGTETFSVSATDDVGATAGPVVYRITVNPLPTVGPTSLPADTVGIAYGESLTASGGTGGVTLAVSNVKNAIAGINLPASGTGVLTIGGAPTTAGTMTFTVTATDTLGGASSAAYAITVNAPATLTPPALPAADVGVAYSQTIGTTGGTGAETLTFTPPQGAIPGIHVTSTAPGTLTVAGTPTASGIETFTVTATDSAGAVTSTPYTLTVAPALALGGAATLPQGVAGDPYSGAVTAAGGTGTVTLTLGSVLTPIPGLVIAPSGTGSLAISGTPAVPGLETFTVNATDQANGSLTQTYTIHVNPALTISPAAGALPSDTVNIVPYHQTITAQGGIGTPTLTLLGVANPLPGLVVPASGVGSVTITGTPTTVGTETLTYLATDALGDRSPASYTITVNPPLWIPTATLPNYSAVGEGYRQVVQATGGTGADTFAVAPTSALPPGLSLDPSSGAVTGVPTVPGTYAYTVNVTDALGGVASRAYSLTVLPFGDSYDSIAHAVELTGTTFSFAQSTSADAAGLHTTYTVATDNGSWTFPDAAVKGGILAVGTGGYNTAMLATYDTYTGTDGLTHATSEAIHVGNGGGRVDKLDAQGEHGLLDLVNFQTVFASAGPEDTGTIDPTPGTKNVFVGAGGYAYMNTGYNAEDFYYLRGAGLVTSTASGPGDYAYQYDGSGPSTFIVSGTRSSQMVGTDTLGGATLPQTFDNLALGYSFNEGIAQNGAQDTAVFYDSPDNDTFTGFPLFATMTSPSGENDQAAFFGQVYVYSFNGGYDQATVASNATNVHVTGFHM